MQGRLLGSEQATITSTAEGWIIRGTGRLAAPVELSTTRFEARYDREWRPISLEVDATLRSRPLIMRTTFAGGQATTEITQAGQQTQKKDVPAIVADHNIPYVATACASYPFDYMAKVKKAAEVEGPAYIHVYSVCPTGWRSAPELTVDIGKLAVETGVFPLWELEGGVYKLNVNPAKLKPVEEYLKPQGRFRHLLEEKNQPLLAEFQANVDQNWAALLKKTGEKVQKIV